MYTSILIFALGFVGVQRAVYHQWRRTIVALLVEVDVRSNQELAHDAVVLVLRRDELWGLGKRMKVVQWFGAVGIQRLGMRGLAFLTSGEAREGRTTLLHEAPAATCKSV